MPDLKNWNVTRVQNFMRRLAKRVTTFDKNVAVLAAHVGISVTEFLNMDPITYGIKVWGFGSYNEPSPIIKKILGNQAYHRCAHLYSLTMEKSLSQPRTYPPLPLSPPGSPEFGPVAPCEIPECYASWCMTMPS